MNRVIRAGRMGGRKVKKLLLVPLMALLAITVLAVSGCGGPSAQDLIREELTKRFDEIKTGGDEFLKELDSTSSDSFNQLGIDGASWAKTYLDGFDYKLGDITVDNDKGTAEAKVTVTCRSIGNILTKFGSQYASKLTSEGITDEAELFKLAGSTLTEVTEAEPTRDAECTFTFTKNDKGEWSIDDSSQQALAEAMTK